MAETCPENLQTYHQRSSPIVGSEKKNTKKLSVTILGTISRHAESLTWKVPNKVLRKMPAQNGVSRKVPKNVPAPLSFTSMEARDPELFIFSTCLATQFWAGTFRSALFGMFPGEGFGIFLNGRQNTT